MFAHFAMGLVEYNWIYQEIVLPDVKKTKRKRKNGTI